jgi:hypothetical protein
VSRFQHLAEEKWRIHQFHFRGILHGPPAQEQQTAETAGIDLRNLGNVKHENPYSPKLFDSAPQVVERDAAHHAPRKADNRYVLQTFDFVLEFHISIHTSLLSKKFPESRLLSLTKNRRKSNQLKIS